MTKTHQLPNKDTTMTTTTTRRPHSAKDQGDPHSWPSFENAFVTFVIGIYGFVVYMAGGGGGFLGLALYVYVRIVLPLPFLQSRYVNCIVL